MWFQQCVKCAKAAAKSLIWPKVQEHEIKVQGAMMMVQGQNAWARE